MCEEGINMKIVIVGGGAAGLMAAINIKNDINEVLILEKNEDWNLSVHFS